MRIGIVDDTAMTRETLRRVVTSVPGHQVVWTAVNGAEAIDRVRGDRPDLILMDLVMPVLDGVQTTQQIMTENPCPILIVTANVARNLNKVYQAMGHGALDAVDTPCLGPLGDLSGAGDLLAKIATIGKLLGLAADRPPRCTPLKPRTERLPTLAPLIAIGASTGGPNALAVVLSAFPRGWKTSVVIVQHIDAALASGMARWLSEQTGHKVRIASPGDRPMPSEVLLAETNDHLMMEQGTGFRYCVEPVGMCYRPSVDVFFSSLVSYWPDPGVGVVLTGMGKDGGSGLLALRNAGWHTITQDEATSVVWGMPRAAAENGGAKEVLPLSAIGPAIVRYINDHHFLPNGESPT